MLETIRTWLGLAVLGIGLSVTMVDAQVVEQERQTTVTGPKGRTIERDIKVERGPGFIDRQVEIKRPGETIIRDTRINTGPGPGPMGGRPFAPGFGGPRFYGGPRFIENVIVQRPPIVSTFVGLPALSFAFGSGGGFIAGGGGGPAGPPQPPPPFDPFTDAVGRLKSFHASSRRDGALTLGRIGDPRAIPALNERLEHDFDKEVRVAAAVALGEIADERGAVALERAVIHDKRHEVRDAAKLALSKIPKPGEAPPPRTYGAVPSGNRAMVPPPLPVRPEVYDPGPTSTPSTNPNPILTPPASSLPNAEDIPPPPPVPMPPGRPSNSLPN